MINLRKKRKTMKGALEILHEKFENKRNKFELEILKIKLRRTQEFFFENK